MAGNRNKAEKPLAEVAEYLHSQIQGSETVIYRAFRVLHPVYSISVDINVENDDESYHIIEKYMDKLICGYTGHRQTEPGEIIIKDKNELFELLGIDRQAYEIAEWFFQDLMEAGHCKVIPGKGIQGLKPAYDSIKYNKKITSKTIRGKRLFDQFSGKLMPKVFSEELERFSLDVGEESDTPSVGLDSRPLSDDEINYMIGNHHYTNNDQIAYNLPQGYQGMAITPGTQVEIAFCPYYLFIFKTGPKLEYKAYRTDNGKPIEWIDEQYKTSSAYHDAIRRLEALSNRQEPLVPFPIKQIKLWMVENDKPMIENGFFRDPETGNYNWIMQDEQIRDMIGLGKDGLYKSAVPWIAERNIQNVYGKEKETETGKIIYIQKTEAQKELLLQAKASDPEYNRQLFDAYLKQTAGENAPREETAEKTPAPAQAEERQTDTPQRKDLNLKETTADLLTASKALLKSAQTLLTEADGLYDTLQNKIRSQGGENVNIDRFYGSDISVSHRKADTGDFYECPFCNAELDDDSSSCSRCGKSFDQLYEVCFSCRSENNYGLTRTINNWIRNSNAEIIPFTNFACDVNTGRNGNQYLSEVKMIYQPLEAKRKPIFRFEVSTEDRVITSDEERKALQEEWKAHHPAGRTATHSMTSKPDSSGKQRLTVCHLYEIKNTSVMRSHPVKNPELTKCPYCHSYLGGKGHSCDRCGESFSEIECVEFTQSDWDHSLLFDEVNSFIANRALDILPLIDIDTSTGSVTFPNGEKREDSFVDKIRICYTPLQKARTYSCCIEQIARYREMKHDTDENELIDSWEQKHPSSRHTCTSYRYKSRNGTGRFDAFAMCFFEDPKDEETEQNEQSSCEPASSSEKFPAPADRSEQPDENNTISAEDRARINQAKLLYDQKQYIDAMETFAEFSQDDAECAFYMGKMYEEGHGFPKDQRKADFWYNLSAELERKQNVKQ